MASGSDSAAGRTRRCRAFGGRTSRPPRTLSSRSTGDGSAVDDRRTLSDQERLGDALFTGLRLVEGVDEAAIRGRYGVDVWERYGTELARSVDAGLLVREGGRLRLTRPGMLLANEVMSVFV